jgi:hypothetical protein
MSTPAWGLKRYAAEKLGPDNELARRDYAQGDINTTLLKTANGRTVTLYYSTLAPRPYDLILRLLSPSSGLEAKGPSPLGAFSSRQACLGVTFFLHGCR